MNSHQRFAKADRPVEALLVGAGAFGRSLLGQGRRMALLNVRVAVDTSVERAVEAFRAAGWSASEIAACTSAADARAAWDAGQCVASARLADVLALPVDILVEASGHPEAGAAHAMAAIEAGRHVALVTKETDSVVGPYLAHAARERGLVCTPVDGDQPALLIALVTWAETLGLTILTAGKSSEYDFVLGEDGESLTSEGRSANAPGFAAVSRLKHRDVRAVIGQRAALAHALPQRAVPDLCELAVVANATGLMPDVPGFHVPIARIEEVATIFDVRENGGLLGGTRRLDVFNALRGTGDVSFAGGVFVTVRCEDRETWAVLAAKGHTMSSSGEAAMIWIPRHLLGLEAPISILDAVVNGANVAGEPTPVVDLVGRTTQPLAAGTRLLAEGHHHTIEGVGPELVPASPLADDRAAPYYLLSGRRLLRDLPAGAEITLADIEPAESTLLTLRRRQDALFFGAGEAASAARMAGG
ncbi:flagellar biosynthesis protein FlgA [Aureimonas phyllosphaerae]|uniref:Putative homoserine dehydrogenase-like protein n=1 Tax=Aureimonas phyllosphaerae TaxID=1166078 RepID=A0A7W6BWA8_9HYPH|nr:flagellar biosynthesis protein FlgA [Aureimonas phyllosphaerae]MBB3937254.1 putative homoserine dehydrogenase-like protein [Aureimonas phyllosphaerae]MBB3961261.1 putative homoserine dehydrogenase-like protein [Aureimonas phyllosphaerae]SFF58170.1 Predicted homoserine dehydrogenase, contains C-terminal SAF domain [Aureimonas phyllosphaerae]